MCKYINKQRGIDKNDKKKKSVNIFDQNYALILRDELSDKVKEGWKSIYQVNNEDILE